MHTFYYQSLLFHIIVIWNPSWIAHTLTRSTKQTFSYAEQNNKFCVEWHSRYASSSLQCAHFYFLLFFNRKKAALPHSLTLYFVSFYIFGWKFAVVFCPFIWILYLFVVAVTAVVVAVFLLLFQELCSHKIANAKREKKSVFPHMQTLARALHLR